jgi:hypothetical protein
MTGRHSCNPEAYDYKRWYELILHCPFSNSLCIQSLARAKTNRVWVLYIDMGKSVVNNTKN